MRIRSVILLPFLIAACASATKQMPGDTTPLAVPTEGPREEAVQLDTPTGSVHGTLLVPGGHGPYPAVLLIAGSGPTDRNGNTAGLPGANSSLKLLAEGLAESGIASLRYDKRGLGESAPAGPSEADLRFDTYVDDAAAWVQKLRNDPRFSTVAIIGHSEGSLIGMLAAQRSETDAFVSIAGIARPAGQVLRDQLRPQLPAPLWEESERILAALEAGHTADSVPQPLYALYRPSVQPYMISWLRYTPMQEIARLSVPVLIVQGTTDIQVNAAEAEALKQADPQAELVVIDGMNHVLKAVPADPAQQRSSYSDPALPVAPQLIEHVAAFIQRHSPTTP